MTVSPKTLVLVHPGSMCGSARSLLGKLEADAARDEVIYEIANHEGHLIVIDGFLSDELSEKENRAIEDSLLRNESEGHLALRIWGCDAGERPPTFWSGFGLQGRHAIFDGQEEAASAISEMIPPSQISVTGAWAREDLASGCATSVLLTFRKILGEGYEIEFSDCALREPDDDPEPDI